MSDNRDRNGFYNCWLHGFITCGSSSSSIFEWMDLLADEVLVKRSSGGSCPEEAVLHLVDGIEHLVERECHLVDSRCGSSFPVLGCTWMGIAALWFHKPHRHRCDPTPRRIRVRWWSRRGEGEVHRVYTICSGFAVQQKGITYAVLRRVWWWWKSIIVVFFSLRRCGSHNGDKGALSLPGMYVISNYGGKILWIRLVPLPLFHVNYYAKDITPPSSSCGSKEFLALPLLGSCHQSERLLHHELTLRKNFSSFRLTKFLVHSHPNE